MRIKFLNGSERGVFVEILSFSRMRSYRKNGRTAALLKLVLPRANDDGQEVFNGFYTDLAECYASIAEGLAASAGGASLPIVLSVNFEVLHDTPDLRRKEKLVAIKRTHRIRCGEKSSAGAFLDFYNADKQIFIK